MAARGTCTLRPLSGKLLRDAIVPAGEPPPGLVERGVRRASAGTYQTGMPASFSRRKSVRASSRTTSMCSSSMRMNGTNSARFKSILVKLARRHVRGGDHDDAALEQLREQPAENHGVGNVGDVEFVEAEQPRLLRKLGRREPDRIFAGVLAELHLLAETVNRARARRA